MTSIAEALLVGDRYFHSLFVWLGLFHSAGCQDFFNGRDDPLEQPGLAE
jgi:hypothetical protein